MTFIADTYRADDALLRQVLSCTPGALSGLIDSAIRQCATGRTRPIEALSAAETWARLAAANGGADELRSLVQVLLARIDFEVTRASVESATWYEAETRRILKLLVAMDDEEARRVLVELGGADQPETDPPSPHDLTLMSAAANGNIDALDALAEQAMTLFHAEGASALETLTIAELYARLGATAGSSALMRRLVGILMKRSEVEYRHGLNVLGDEAYAEAVVVMSIMNDCGDTTMAPWLRSLVEDAPRQPLARAIQRRATILKFVEPEGCC